MVLLGIILYSFLGFLILGLAYAIWLFIDILPARPVRKNESRGNRNRSDRLEEKLLTMVGGDRSVATRLLVNVRFKYPQKSKTWCYEKVIHDLQRDRRAI